MPVPITHAGRDLIRDFQEEADHWRRELDLSDDASTFTRTAFRNRAEQAERDRDQVVKAVEALELELVRAVLSIHNISTDPYALAEALREDADAGVTA